VLHTGSTKFILVSEEEWQFENKWKATWLHDNDKGVSNIESINAELK